MSIHRHTSLLLRTVAVVASLSVPAASVKASTPARYRALEVSAAPGVSPLFTTGIDVRGRIAVAAEGPDGTLPAIARPDANGSLVVEVLPLLPDAVRGFSRGVNAGGLVGGYVFDADYDGTQGIIPVLWRVDGDQAGDPLPRPIALPDLGFGWGIVSGVTASDIAFGYSKTDAGDWKPVLWRPNADGRTWSLDPLPWDRPDWGSVSDVNLRGQAVITTVEVIPVGLPEIPAVWSPRPMNGLPAGMTILPSMPDAPEGTGYRSILINESGVVAGYEDRAGIGRTIVRWVDGVPERLDPAEGCEVPFGLDEDGRILTLRQPAGTLAWIERDMAVTDIDAGVDGPFFLASHAPDGRLAATKNFPGAPDGTRVLQLSPATGGSPDIDGDGSVGLSDLLELLASWTSL